MRWQEHQTGERGAALVMVVGLVAVMGAMVVAVQYEISRSIAYVQATKTGHGARQMAEVGLAAALILLKFDHEEDSRNNAKRDYYFQLDEEEAGIDALLALQNSAELWSMFSPHGFSPLEALGLPGTMVPIGQDGGVEISIDDQSAKWNFHRLLTPRGVKMSDDEAKVAVNGFTYLFEDNELARQLVATGIDWMDANDGIVDPLSAERLYYEELDAPYEPRNGPFQHHEELRALANVDEEIYQAMLSGVTTWPNDLKLYSEYKININTAPPEALAFLHQDMTEDLIDIIIEDREEGEFQSVGDLGKLLQGEGAAAVWAKPKDGKVPGILDLQNATVRSRAFLVRATGFTIDGQATLEAVIDRNNTRGRLRVLTRRWRYLE